MSSNSLIAGDQNRLCDSSGIVTAVVFIVCLCGFNIMGVEWESEVAHDVSEW